MGKSGKITVTGEIINTGVGVELVTTDLREAVAGAELIFLPVPAFAHATYARMLPPLLEDG